MEGTTPNPNSKRPFAHDQNDVQRSQRHERSSGDPLPETPSCVSHLAGVGNSLLHPFLSYSVLFQAQKLISSQTAEIPDRNIDKLKNIRRRRGDERSKASIQSNTASVPRHQPYGRHRIRTKLRQLVPASSAPNSSVLENQQQEYERQILLSSRSKRTASRVDGAFAFLAQTPLPCSVGQPSSSHHQGSTLPTDPGPRYLFQKYSEIPLPYSAGQPSSSHHQSYMLPMDPGRRHPFQQHDVSYGNMPAGSGDSRLSQPRAVTGFNVAPAPPPASFSQPLLAAGTYHQGNICGNLTTWQQGQLRDPSTLAGFSHPGDQGPRLMVPPRPYRPTVADRYPAMPSTGLSVHAASPTNGLSPGSYYGQHQLLPTQFGMATVPGMAAVPGMGTGQPQQPTRYSAVPASVPAGSYSGFAPRDSTYSNVLKLDPTSPYLLDPEAVGREMRLYPTEGTGENGNEGLDKFGNL